ncbi:tetratricopeptide repeat protein [Lentzea sp. BCCO 10_0856]|uniref:Tetratricopeptide repeat protein n=1 Tax=Lentzea miocenica TaxID=3095431 RepID=A0ABU4SST3_9PSEU|nr:tetratricopeptide repeat protein [Lentzea sp. BCCO 10_0856]MDX8028949.1 tetratricopeptide repeat protein [Lentzea sp. BCCO 10_0856]
MRDNDFAVHDSTGYDFNAYQPNGEVAADRWVTATHLFDAGHVDTAADKWDRAQLLFEARDYVKAAQLLAEVVEEVPFQTDLFLLLARAYFHSAQLGKAEARLRVIVDRDPVEHYAHLLLGRTLERQGRPEEAAPWLRLAAAFGGDLAEV